MYKISPEDSYSIRLFSEMLEYGISEMDHFKRLPDLPPEAQDIVLGHLAEMAFSAQHYCNICLGIEALLQVPKEWLFERLDFLLKDALLTDDSWEYLRIAEFLDQFDKESHQRFLRKCGEHPDPDIREIPDYEWASSATEDGQP